MSFREKTAWVTLCAYVIVSLMYWLHVPSLIEPHPHVWVMHAMAASLMTFVLIEIVAYVVLRLRNPQEARAPRDERERLIDLKALRIAYFVFAVGTLGGIFMTVHLTGASPAGVGTAVFLAFVLAQIARQVACVVYYRRGA